MKVGGSAVEDRCKQRVLRNRRAVLQKDEMHTWLQGFSTAIIESQSIKTKAQSLPLPSITTMDVNLTKKDKEKRFSFFPKKK